MVEMKSQLLGVQTELAELRETNKQVERQLTAAKEEVGATD